MATRRKKKTGGAVRLLSLIQSMGKEYVRGTVAAIATLVLLCSCEAQTLEQDSTISCRSSDESKCATTQTNGTTEAQSDKKEFEKVESKISPDSDVRWVYDNENENVYLGMEVSAPAGFAARDVNISIQLTRLADFSGYNLSVQGSDPLTKPIQLTFPYAVLENKTAAQREAMRFVFQSNAGPSWAITDTKKLRSAEGIVGVTIDEWGVIVITDPVIVSESSPESGITTQSGISDPHAPSAPEVMLSTLPAATNTTSALNVTVSGQDVAQYRYQILDGLVSCAAATTLSTWRNTTQKITASIGIDGNKTLCVKGRASDNVEEVIFKSHQWLQDAQAPIAAGDAVSFIVDPAHFEKAILTWASAASDLGTGVNSQQLLLFANNNTDCSGTPSQTISLATTDTTYTWERKASGLFSTIRFRVRATDTLGRVSDSNCSGNIKLDNGNINLSTSKSNLKMGSQSPYPGYYYYQGASVLKADMTGDGIDDLIFGDPTYKFDRGYIAILQGGISGLNSGIKVYEGELSGDQLGDFSNTATYTFKDINGDGYLDLLSSNRDASPGGNGQAGSIYIVLGGSTLADSGMISQMGRRYDGHAQRHWLCREFAFGDINNDGFDDIIATSPQAYSNSLGSVAIIPGGSALPASGQALTQGYVYDASVDYSKFSQIFAVADVSGDGKKDLVILGGEGVSVVLGASTLPASGVITSAALVYSNTSPSAYVQSLEVADVTGDGIADIVAGYMGQSTAYQGYIWVLQGGNLPASGAINSVYYRRYTGSNNDKLGYGLFLQDINCDGVKDIITIGTDTTFFSTYPGKIFVMLGGTLPASNNFATAGGRIFSDSYADEGVGKRLTFKDLNNDGCMDMYSSYFSASPGGRAGAGSIHFMFGNSTFPSTGQMRTAGRVIDGPVAGEGSTFTANFDFIADQNGDSKMDLIVGSPAGTRNAATGAGSFSFISGAFPASGQPQVIGKEISGTTAGSGLGSIGLLNYNFAYPGPIYQFQDVNGDGNKDLIFTSALGMATAGAIHIIPGPINPSASDTIDNVGYSYYGDAAGDGLGNAITVTDLNNDGYKDIISLTKDADPNSLTDSSSVYILFGSSGFAGSGNILTSGVRINGSFAGDGFDRIMFEDLTGDNRKEIILINSAASPSGNSGAGSVVIIPMPATPWAAGAYSFSDLGAKRFNGATAGSNLGKTLVIGEFNGDGMKDVAYVYGAGTTSGGMQLIKGNASFSALTATSVFSNTAMGAYLNMVDIDQDGKFEILVGAGPASSGGFSENGGIYVVNSDFSSY